MIEDIDSHLDNLLAEVRAQGIVPSPALSESVRAEARKAARVMGQAWVGQERRSPPVMGPGPWEPLGTAIGGWPGLGGLAVAALAGIWFGMGSTGSGPAVTDDGAGRATGVAEEVTVGLGLDEDPLAAFDPGGEF